MATIRKRGNRYFVQIRKRGYSQSKSFDCEHDAVLWAKEIESLIDIGKLKAGPTLNMVIAEYSTVYMPDKAAGTQAMQVSQLKIWAELLGNKAVDDITATDINRVKIELISKRNITKATVNRYLQALSPVFTFALEQGYIDQNPFKLVKKFKEPPGRVRYLQQDEMVRLLRECKRSSSVHLYNVSLLALLTGMRYGEIVALKWQDIDFKNGFILLNKTKNGEKRALPITDNLSKLLNSMPKTSGYLFASERTGRPVHLLPSFRNAAKRAGLADFHFHDLRHTAASYLAMSGADSLTIAAILGHKTLSMVKRYAHLNNAHKMNALDKLHQDYSLTLDF